MIRGSRGPRTWCAQARAVPGWAPDLPANHARTRNLERQSPSGARDRGAVGSGQGQLVTVSSQRIREQRIIARLQAGDLALASASDTADPTPNALGCCHGCLEAETDAHVGDDPWHLLCVLFWKGRSETLRERPIPHTQPGLGVTPMRPRWVVVVRVGRPDTSVALRRSFARSAWVDVVMDRRRGERRHAVGRPPGGERRTGGRRCEDHASRHAPAFRLAHRGDGFVVYEATGPELVHCLQCGAVLSVELPRFSEPPVRLDVIVLHEALPADHTRARHMVELQSWSATGRILLASRLSARTGTQPT